MILEFRFSIAILHPRGVGISDNEFLRWVSSEFFAKCSIDSHIICGILCNCMNIAHTSPTDSGINNLDSNFPEYVADAAGALCWRPETSKVREGWRDAVPRILKGIEPLLYSTKTPYAMEYPRGSRFGGFSRPVGQLEGWNL